MTAETILTTLVRVNLVASAAILLVLMLRPLVLRWLGASIAWWLWLVIPVVIAANLLPARAQVVLIPPPEIRPAPVVASPVVAMPVTQKIASAVVTSAPVASAPAFNDALVALWLLGAAALLARSIINTRRLAADPSVGPALVGVVWPTLVLPTDFETRFDAQERALILAHEEFHRVSGHTVINALVEVARCLGWFNPLVHFAAARIRMDQELAVDAAVIAARPSERRVYAEALLKTRIAPAFLPLGCTWTSRSAKRMGERIELLAQAAPGRWRKFLCALTIAGLGVTLGYTAWAQQPEHLLTRMMGADAPKGMLSPIEKMRHERALAQTKAGDIEVVFFGTTNTEMWLWPDRGRPVWNKLFYGIKADNFGSQGTRPESLLWRMQNGELDGYQAKLVVLSAFDPVDAAVPDSDRANYVAQHERIIAEIEKRQPKAKILIIANIPRGFLTLEQWQKVSAVNAAVMAALIDNKSVFYADIGARFYTSDGSHNQAMWTRSGPPNAGMQAPGFEAWAEEMQPWLNRFVH